MAEGISLNIDFETKEALAALKKIESETKKSTSQISSAFNAVKGVAATALAVFGARELTQFFTNGIKAATEQEKALRGLNSQLALTGEGGREAAQGFLEYAEALEETTLIQAETILESAKLAKAFGLSNAEAKTLTTAAIDLAAATGKSLPEATRALALSYSGNTREIERLVPGIKGLTKEQLANGAAIKLVGDRYRGAAEEGVAPFERALFQLEESFDDVSKTIGRFFIDAGSLTKLLSTTAEAVKILAGGVDGLRLSDFVNAVVVFGLSVVRVFVSIGIEIERAIARTFEFVLRTIAEAIRALQKFLDFASLLDISALTKPLGNAADSVEGLADSLTAAEKESDRLVGRFDQVIQSIADAGQATQELKKSFDGAGNSGRNFGEQTADEIAKLREEALKFTRDLELKGFSSLQRLDKETQDNVIKLENYFKEGRISFDEFQRGITGLTAAYAAERTKIVEEEAKKQEEAFRKTTEEIAKFVSPLASGLSQGAAGAAGFVTGTLSAGIDAILPGIGSAVKPLLDLFAQGPEQTKAAVKAFVEAIPDIIDAIAESIPVFVETLVDVLVNKGGAVRIGLAIAKAIYEAPFRIVGEVIGRWFGVEFNKLFTAERLGAILAGAFEKVRDIIAGIFSEGAAAISRAISGIGNGIVNGIDKFISTIRQTLSSIGQTVFQGINQAFVNSTRIFIEGVRSFFADLFTSFRELFASVTAPFRQIFNSVVNFFRQTVENFRNIFTNFIPTIAAAFQGIVEAIKNLPQTIVQALKDSLDEIANTVKAALSFLTEEPGWVKSFRETVSGQKAKNAFTDPDNPIRRGVLAVATLGTSELLRAAGVPGFANGGVVGPDTRLALTRPDEMMLNPRQQSNLFRQLNSGTIGSDDALPLLAKIATLLEGGTTVETSINIGPDKLATAILNLNRRNARLTT